MTASPEFVMLMQDAVNKMTEHLANNSEAIHGYVVLGIENGNIENMSTLSNLDPQIMITLLAIIAHHTTAIDVTEETIKH